MKLILTSEFYDSFGTTRQLLGNNLKKKKALFIPTAAYGEGLNPEYEKNIKPLEGLGLSVTDFDIAEKSYQQVNNQVRKTDIIYVCGGDTFHLLHHMNACGFKKSLMAFLERGGVYIGSSAGSIVLSPDIEFISLMESDKNISMLDDYTGLNLINLSFLPHLDHETMGHHAQKIIEKYKNGSQSIFALCDNQLLHIDGKIIQVI